MTTITIVDESMLGEKHAWNLDFLDETMSLRELIQRRIYQEVIEYNARQSGYFHGLVQPTNTEHTLNGYRLKSTQRLDWKALYEKAIEAFICHGYIVLVNDKQVADLDISIELRDYTEVMFFKLVPLVGG